MKSMVFTMSSEKVLLLGHDSFYGRPLQKLIKSRSDMIYFELPEDVNPSNDPYEFNKFLSRNGIDAIIDVGGLSYGIQGNVNYPAELFLDNLRSLNSIRLACLSGIKKYVFYASSCCYPRSIEKPMEPKMLYSGPLEPTNQAYASVKLAGLELCKAIRQQYGFNYNTLIPSNIYGPHDDFSEKNSHVVGALIKRFTEAAQKKFKSISIWGSGAAKRDFLHVDDLAEATLVVLKKYNDIEPVNIGSGNAVQINEIALLIGQLAGFEGDIHYDKSKPDGMPIKVLSSKKIMELGWRPAVDLKSGLCHTLDWYSKHL